MRKSNIVVHSDVWLREGINSTLNNCQQPHGSLSLCFISYTKLWLFTTKCRTHSYGIPIFHPGTWLCYFTSEKGIVSPICSMYGICTNICPINHPNVGKYIIYGPYRSWRPNHHSMTCDQLVLTTSCTKCTAVETNSCTSCADAIVNACKVVPVRLWFINHISVDIIINHKPYKVGPPSNKLSYNMG